MVSAIAERPDKAGGRRQIDHYVSAGCHGHHISAGVYVILSNARFDQSNLDQLRYYCYLSDICQIFLYSLLPIMLH